MSKLEQGVETENDYHCVRRRQLEKIVRRLEGKDVDEYLPLRGGQAGMTQANAPIQALCAWCRDAKKTSNFLLAAVMFRHLLC